MTRDGEVRAWDPETGRAIASPIQTGGRGAIPFLRDGTRFVAGAGNVVRVFGVDTGQSSPPLRHDGLVTMAIFGPDGRRFAAAETSRSVRIHVAATGAAVGRPLLLKDTLQAARFAPDGRRLVTVGYEGILRWWDEGTGELLGNAWESGRADLSAFRGDVLALAGAQTPETWELRTRPLPDFVSVEDPRPRAQRNTGLRLDRNGDLQALSPDDWDGVKSR